jgi:hypothetical protein
VVFFALLVCPGSLVGRLGLGALVLLTAALLTSPWLMRNQRVLGAAVLNTNGGFNLYIGNNPSATGWHVSIADTPRGGSWNTLRQNGELQASALLKQEALEWIREHPAAFASLALKKAVYFWMPPHHDGQGDGSLAETVIRRLWLLQFVVLLGLALVSLALRPLHNRQVAMLWMAIAAYTAVHMLFYVIFRYREPVMPMVVVLAALVVERLLTASRRSGRGQSERPESGTTRIHSASQNTAPNSKPVRMLLRSFRANTTGSSCIQPRCVTIQVRVIQ